MGSINNLKRPKIVLDVGCGKGEYLDAFNFFETIDVHMFLKIHTYFMWANDKMNTHFFMENKGNISEDLLSEFRSTNTQPNKVSQAGAHMKAVMKQDNSKLPSRL